MSERDRKMLDLIFSEDLDEMVLGVDMLKNFTCKEGYLKLDARVRNLGNGAECAKRVMFSVYPNVFYKESNISTVSWYYATREWALKNPYLKHDPKWRFKVPAWLSPDDVKEYNRLNVVYNFNVEDLNVKR
jgi:hypothetical protein